MVQSEEKSQKVCQIEANYMNVNVLKYNHIPLSPGNAVIYHMYM
jgi:hypothetical protein